MPARSGRQAASTVTLDAESPGRAPSATPEGITLAPQGVQLGILQDVLSARTPAELREPSAWLVGGDECCYFEAVGPFSAIDPVRHWVLDRGAVEGVTLALGSP